MNKLYLKVDGDTLLTLLNESGLWFNNVRDNGGLQVVDLSFFENPSIKQNFVSTRYDNGNFIIFNPDSMKALSNKKSDFWKMKYRKTRNLLSKYEFIDERANKLAAVANNNFFDDFDIDSEVVVAIPDKCLIHDDAIDIRFGGGTPDKRVTLINGFDFSYIDKYRRNSDTNDNKEIRVNRNKSRSIVQKILNLDESRQLMMVIILLMTTSLGGLSLKTPAIASADNSNVIVQTEYNPTWLEALLKDTTFADKVFNPSFLEPTMKTIAENFDNVIEFRYSYGKERDMEDFERILQYEGIFIKYANMYGVDPNLAMAVGATESSGMANGGTDTKLAWGLMGIAHNQNETVHEVFNYDTGEMDNVTFSEKDLESNIQYGVVSLAESYNYAIYFLKQGKIDSSEIIPATLTIYNIGFSNFQYLVDNFGNRWSDNIAALNNADSEYYEKVLALLPNGYEICIGDVWYSATNIVKTEGHSR